VLGVDRTERRLGRRPSLWDEGRKPVDVSKADPVRRPFGRDFAGLGDIAVVVREVHRAAERADRAGMDRPGILAGGAVSAVDERIGLRDHRRGRGVRHGLRGGDHVAIVDRKADGELLALPVVPRERDRIVRRKRAPARLPHGLGVRHLDALADPTELRELLRGRSVRGEQPLGRRILVDRLAVALELDIVDSRADRIDRAEHGRGVDLDAPGRGEIGRQILLLDRDVLGVLQAAFAGRA